MNRFIFVIFFTFIFPALFMDGSIYAETPKKKGSQPERPIMDLERTRIDLGSVKEGETVLTRFFLENEGSEKLIINKVKSGCKCTSADYPGVVPAGGNAVIKLKIDTLGIYGRKTFKTAIYSNDPKRPVVTLRVRADITPLVTLTPDRIFLKGRQGEGLRQEILIDTRGKIPLDVKIKRYDLQGRVKLELEPVIKDRQYRLTVESLVKKAGSFRGRIILNTNYPGRKKIAVPVFVYKQEPIGIYPERLSLKTRRCPTCEGKLFGEFLIRSHDNNSLKITSVDLPSSECKYNIVPLITDQAHNIQVECNNKKESPGKKFINIQTNRPDNRQIKVPIVTISRGE